MSAMMPGASAAPGPINGAARPEADVLAGVIRIPIGGQLREMPVLVASKSRAWKTELMKAIGGVKLPPADEFSVEWAAALAQQVSDEIVDLLATYDETNALSGARTKAAAKKWLADNATDLELYAAIVEVLKATFPFVADPQAMVMEVLGDAMREQYVSRARTRAQEMMEATLVSSSGPSTTGEESPAPQTSSTDGPTSRSSSSLTEVKSASKSKRRPRPTG